LRDRAKEIAGLLAEKDSIPMVRQQMPLIQEVLSDEWMRRAFPVSRLRERT
jgi:type I restriction enzyme R subunit